MAPLPTRKRLLFLIRKKYPKFTLKYSKTFVLIVQECLLKLLKLEQPLNHEDSVFLSNEVNNFAKVVPEYFRKAGRSQANMLKKHSCFFDKAYPYSVPEQPTPVKRSYVSKSRSQQYKERAKIAQEDKEAVYGAASMLLKKEGHADAAFVVKRITDNPSIGSDLRMKLIDLDESKTDERLIYF